MVSDDSAQRSATATSATPAPISVAVGQSAAHPASLPNGHGPAMQTVELNGSYNYGGGYDSTHSNGAAPIANQNGMLAPDNGAVASGYDASGSTQYTDAPADQPAYDSEVSATEVLSCYAIPNDKSVADDCPLPIGKPNFILGWSTHSRTIGVMEEAADFVGGASNVADVIFYAAYEHVFDFFLQSGAADSPLAYGMHTLSACVVVLSLFGGVLDYLHCFSYVSSVS